jgi:hypothetical protein
MRDTTGIGEDRVMNAFTGLSRGRANDLAAH